MRSKKLKVIRKLTDTQLQLSNSYTGISGINTITSMVGIASTTIVSETCFVFSGRRTLEDTIPAVIAVQAPGTYHGNYGSGNPFGSGGAPGASSGSNFIYGCLNDVSSSSWCISQVSAGCTAGIFCQASASSDFMIANRGLLGNPGNPAGPDTGGEHPQGRPGNPGNPGLSSSLLCTYATSNMFYNISCHQGCPGTGCPPACLGLGGLSGYVCSPFCSTIKVECLCYGNGQSMCCVSPSNPSSGLGRGWVHVNTTGRKENLI